MKSATGWLSRQGNGRRRNRRAFGRKHHVRIRPLVNFPSRKKESMKMTIQIISLAECPFCPDDAGGVFLDARKVMMYRMRGAPATT